MSTPKYCLLPGMVTSSTDGQRHYISANVLAKLYGVNLDECVIVPWFVAPQNWRQREMQIARHKHLIQLRPMANGDYSIPTKP